MSSLEQSEQLLDGIKAGGLLFKNKRFAPLKLFFDSKNKRHYFIPDKNLKCISCKENIFDIIVFCFNWSNKKSNMETFCVDCSIKIERNITAVISETILAVMVDKPPKKTYPVFIGSPNMNNFRGDISIFEAGDINFRKGDHTDSNYHELISSKSIPKIDDKKAKRLSEERIKQLSKTFGKFRKDINIEGIEDYLNHIMESKPVIEYQDKKLLNGVDKS